MDYFSDLIQIKAGKITFLTANNLYEEESADYYFVSDFEQLQFFYDRIPKLIGSVSYNNVYESTITGRLFVNNSFDERIIRNNFKKSDFNYSIAIQNINKTVYPSTAVSIDGGIKRISN